jgi:hypothetical protein
MSDPVSHTPTESAGDGMAVVVRDRRVLAGLIWEMRAKAAFAEGQVGSAKAFFQMSLRCFALADDDEAVVRVVDDACRLLGINLDSDPEDGTDAGGVE